jgi:acetyl-CoA acetyltransferase family protein
MMDVVVIDAVRTPMGRLGGALAGVRPDDLLATVLRALAARVPQMDPADLDEVYAGDANGAGEDNRNVARMASLLAGFPVTVPGATMNRLCGSGMEAILSGSRAIAVGDAQLVIASGVESMTRAPWVLPKPAKGFPTSNEQLWNSALGWRMVNPQMPREWTVSLGESTEMLATEYEISREEQDRFAAASHERAAQAWESGLFNDEVVGVNGVDLSRDESLRADTTVERLSGLKPVFRDGGSVTAGNSSPMNDGAAAMLLASTEMAERLGVQPMARIVSRATCGVEPHRFGIGPVRASQIALERAGLTWDQVDVVELNEAFAAQSLACLRDLPDLDPAKVNPQGGAIALGHPLGCSGVRITTTLAHRLRRTGQRYGLATMCIGVGQGIAVVLENIDR